MSQSARLSLRSSEIAEELHSITGKSKTHIIEIALEEYRYQVRMRMYNDAYAKKRSDSTAWEEELKDRAELDGTIADGLDEE